MYSIVQRTSDSDYTYCFRILSESGVMLLNGVSRGAIDYRTTKVIRGMYDYST